MHDSGARRHHAKVIEGLLAPLQEFVAFGVAGKLVLGVDAQGFVAGKGVDLYRVIDHQITGHQRIHFARTRLVPGHAHLHWYQFEKTAIKTNGSR